MLNPPSGANNAGADCKSVYAPGGVNKGDCSELYFLFTHLCSAGWRSDAVYLKPCGWLACIFFLLFFFQTVLKLGGLDRGAHVRNTLSASLTKSIFNTPSRCLRRNGENRVAHNTRGIRACAHVCVCVCEPVLGRRNEIQHALHKC